MIHFILKKLDFDVVFTRKHFIIKWGINLYFCLRETEKFFLLSFFLFFLKFSKNNFFFFSEPFRVDRHYKGNHDICGINLVNDQLVRFFFIFIFVFLSKNS